jgi:mannose-1-phosphate guanylyltransferase
MHSDAPMKIERPYVVVLAGGEGNRLASLTRALYGHDLPKQFAVLSGERSLLQTTLERAALLTSLDRISVVASARPPARRGRSSARLPASTAFSCTSRSS